MPQLGEIKTNPNNPAQSARWDGRQWVDASGPKAAPAWGPGAVEMPNGVIMRPGRGGRLVVIPKTGRAEAGGGAVERTEDQGKSFQNAGLLSPAENDYRRARAAGYDPGTVPNSFASFLEGIPVLPLGGLAPMFRDDVSDRGRNAELRWTEGNLRSRSGAAIKDDEVARESVMFFPGFARNSAETANQLQRARAESFRGVLGRAAPGDDKRIPRYPYTPKRGQSPVVPDLSRMTPEQVTASKQFRGTNAPSGNQRNPFIPLTAKQLKALPPGAFYIDLDGQIVRKGH